MNRVACRVRAFRAPARAVLRACLCSSLSKRKSCSRFVCSYLAMSCRIFVLDYIQCSTFLYRVDVCLCVCVCADQCCCSYIRCRWLLDVVPSLSYSLSMVYIVCYQDLPCITICCLHLSKYVPYVNEFSQDEHERPPSGEHSRSAQTSLGCLRI